LVAGGFGASGLLVSAEIYDPVGGVWIPAASMDRPRLPQGVALRDGRILVVDLLQAQIDSQLYDPVANTWAPSVTTPATFFTFTRGPVALPDGSALFLFGRCVGSGCDVQPIVFDVRAERWSRAAPLDPVGGFSFDIATLPDGRPLFVGVGGGTDARFFRPDDSPRLTISPLTVDFARAEPGIGVQRSVSVQNSGGATLTGTATTSAPFSVVSGSPFTLPPGTSTTAVLQLSPPGLGQFSGVVHFMSNGNSLSVAVTGTSGVRLSGQITDAVGVEVIGVTVDLTGASSGSAVTDAGGNYQFFVQPSREYQVTPTSPGVAFTPSTRSVSVGTQDVSRLGFTAAVVDAVSVFVAGLYQNVLGRIADPPGLEFWTTRLHQHCHENGLSAIAQAFFDSPEFRTSRPLTLPDLVTTLYRVLLARGPEPGGLAYWAGVFRQDRLSLATAFVESAEFRNLLPDRTNRQALTAIVTRFYTEILGRAPEPSGLTGWIDHIVATGDVGSAAVAFLTSAEFEQRALTFREYVTLLDRGVLGRDPEPAGPDYWEGVLRSSLLSIINDGFIPSAESQRRIPQVCGS
jgi:hypothetical protein